jgi:hypothetical protein
MNPALMYIRMRRKIKKNVIQYYQKCIYTFHCKGNIPMEACRDPEFHR